MLPKPSLRKHRMLAEKDLHIIAFLNLMVILIPFLLITAVFARMAVIELAPSGEIQAAAQKHKETAGPKFRLIITIKEDEIGVLNDTTLLWVFREDEKGSYNFSALSNFLLQLKQKNREENAAVILSRPYIPYITLVETIDAVRETFPDISLDEL